MSDNGGINLNPNIRFKLSQKAILGIIIAVVLTPLCLYRCSEQRAEQREVDEQLQRNFEQIDRVYR